MYNVPQYKPEIKLISNVDGVVGVYPDYETFLDDINYRFVDNWVVTTFKDWPSRWMYNWNFDGTCLRYIVRDKFGSVFSPTEILNDISKRNKWNSVYHQRCSKRYDFIYRQTPVPFTGKRGHGFHCWHKTPRTTQELRWNCAHKGYTRGNRHKGMLPTAWDDYQRGDVRTRKNWKSCRRTQWKETRA